MINFSTVSEEGINVFADEIEAGQTFTCDAIADIETMEGDVFMASDDEEFAIIMNLTTGEVFDYSETEVYIEGFRPVEIEATIVPA